MVILGLALPRMGKSVRTLALSESAISPLAVGNVVLVGLDAGEEGFEGRSAGAILAINRLSSGGRGSSGLAIGSSKQGVGNVVTSNATGGL